MPFIMKILPAKVNALLACAENEKPKVANECITQLALVLERSSVSGGGSGID